jgi:hypothetical protein
MKPNILLHRTRKQRRFALLFASVNWAVAP